MMNRTKSIIGFATISTFLITAGCAPGKSSNHDSQDEQGESLSITEPVSAEDVKELGDVTLNVWADAGEEATIEELIPRYEKEFTNVKVDVTYKGWDDLMGTVVNAMDSDNPPDVTNGNQGFATMGTMVAGNMIRP